MSALVSVIVPTRNSEKTITMCLESIRRQTYSNVEIVIVDAYSCDGTRRIAERYGPRIVMSRAYRSEARNIGVRESRGDFVLFVDSDMELGPSVVQGCVEKSEKHYDALVIPEVSSGTGFWAQCKALEKSCYLGDDTIEAARFFKRSVFQGIGGYDPELEAGEDWDLNQRTREAGFKIGRIDALINHNEGELRLRHMLDKKYRYGKTIGKYRKKHPRESGDQLAVIRPAFLRNWKRLVREPAELVGMSFLKLCEFGAWVFGMLTNKIGETEEATNSSSPE